MSLEKLEDTIGYFFANILYDIYADIITTIINSGIVNDIIRNLKKINT